MAVFYDGSDLLSRNQYNIFFSLGGRNVGKSTFWQRFIIRHYIKDNEKFVIIVKYKDDLSTFAANYFSQQWMDKWYPDYEILYKRGKYFIREKGEWLDDRQGWKQCGYAIALNMNASLKSTTTFQDATNILFEEFMPLEDKYIGSAKDPEKEPKLLTSVYQTIARGEKGQRTRKVRLICISNNYTMNNPYFTYFNILPMVSSNPNTIFQRFYTYDKGDLHYALEFSQLKPETTGIEADEEATGVQFSDFRNELKIPKKLNMKKIKFQLTFDGRYVINIAAFNDTIIAYKGKEINKDYICYTCSQIKKEKVWGIKALKGTPRYKELVDYYERNDMFYDKLETYIQLTNVLAY